MKAAIRIWKQMFKVLTGNPVIVLPFFIVGLFDAISLILIYLAPQPPFSIVLAPPIRAFWGEQYLHYPFNLSLIPRLFSYAHIATSAVFGVLITGLAIGMLNEIRRVGNAGVLLNIIRAFKRYFSLFTIWLIMFILATLIYKIPHLFISVNNKAALQIAFYLSFLMVGSIQIIFIYAFPAAFIEQRGVVSAIRCGVSLCRSHFLTSLMLVMLPTLFYLPVMVLKGNSLFLMQRFFPEIVLIILGLAIVVSVVIDCLVTCSTTILFLNQRKE